MREHCSGANNFSREVKNSLYQNPKGGTGAFSMTWENVAKTKIL